eukprot:2179117-Rhodomonas_salina.2
MLTFSGVSGQRVVDPRDFGCHRARERGREEPVSRGQGLSSSRVQGSRFRVQGLRFVCCSVLSKPIVLPRQRGSEAARGTDV